MPGQAAELVFDNVTKRYEGREGDAVHDLSFTVPAGEICVLVGPSGGGKTPALKLVNRLIEMTSGDIRIDGKSIREQNLVQLRRGIGYVIQQVGLFPHMTIEANIGTVPRLYGQPRPPGGPPGGRRRGAERGAGGRAGAPAAHPPGRLMDEPFGAIDPIVRA